MVGRRVGLLTAVIGSRGIGMGIVSTRDRSSGGYSEY